MAKVIDFPSLIDVPRCLRMIADEIDAGQLEVPNGLTMVSGDQVYHLGTSNSDEAMKSAIYNLTVGQHSLAHRVVRGISEEGDW